MNRILHFVVAVTALTLLLAEFGRHGCQTGRRQFFVGHGWRRGWTDPIRVVPTRVGLARHGITRPAERGLPAH